MKKIIGIMTAFAVTLCALSCVVMPVALAEDSAETGEKTELIMGNIPDEPMSEFKVELVGDTIKITTSPGAYFFHVMCFIFSNNKYEINCNYKTGECLLKPESNGKYLIMRPVGVPGTEGSFGYNKYYDYLLFIDINENVVNISSDETDDNSINNNDLLCRIFEDTGTAFAHVGIDQTLNEQHPIWLVLRGEGANCSFFSENIERLGNVTTYSLPDDPQKVYKTVRVELGDYGEVLGGTAVITGQKEGTIFKKENGKITKYTLLFDIYSWNPETDGEGLSYYTPNSFKSVVIPENDINLDGAVNLKDVFLLRRYIAGGWDIELKEIQKEMADLNGDEKIDLKDVVLLRCYIAGGWD